MKGLPPEARARLLGIFSVEGERVAVRAAGWLAGARELSSPDELDAAGPAVAGALYGATDAASLTQDVLLITDRVQEACPIAIVARTKRARRAGVRAALLGAIGRGPTLLIEDLSEALLLARVSDVRAIELDDADGWSLVWGRAPGPR